MSVIERRAQRVKNVSCFSTSYVQANNEEGSRRRESNGMEAARGAAYLGLLQCDMAGVRLAWIAVDSGPWTVHPGRKQ